MKKLRVGVIGTGNMGRHHVRVYSQLEQCELVGVCDLNKEAADKFAAQFNTKAYYDYKEMLNDVDAVSVCVPTSHHYTVGKDVMNAGVHVLIEKPICKEVSEAEEITLLAKEKGIKCMVGHSERFNPNIVTLKRLLGDDHIKVINTTRVGPFPPQVNDVGVITDIGVHDIDLIQFLSGSTFDECSSYTSGTGEFEDAAVMSFKMKNGSIATSTVDWLTPTKIREIRVVTNERLYLVDLMGNMITEYADYNIAEQACLFKQIPVKYEEPLMKELGAFCDAIINDTEVPITAEHGLAVLKIAKACLKK